MNQPKKETLHETEYAARTRLPGAMARLKAQLESLEGLISEDYDTGPARDSLFGSVVEVDRLLSTIDAIRRVEAGRS